MNNNDFELISHTADLQIRVYGKTIAELFRHALIGMFQAIEPRSTLCSKQGDRIVCSSLPIEHTIGLDAVDHISLLVDFLSEALYLSDVHNQAYLDATIHELTDTHIDATIRGVPITGCAIEIKAVTYHDLAITSVNGIWQADIVFDI